jgi:HAD superfamily hydrolase (TIGR01450 family)
VLLGFDKTITYDKIDKAYQLIKEGTPYIATHPDYLCPTEDGFIPDVGGFIAMFKKYTGRSPVIIGKPYTPMIKSALKQYQSTKAETAIIGDRIYTDMKMGKKSGILSILVLSGETKSTKGLPFYPDIAVKNIGELIKYL